MTSGIAIQMLSEVLWNALLVAAPLLLATLVTGLVVSILQVVTQIQERSLTYVPKIIVAVIVLAALGPWMLKRLVNFSVDLISSIPRQF